MSPPMEGVSHRGDITTGIRVLVLLSGGVDSTACVHYYMSNSYQVAAFFVDYGQPQSLLEEKAADGVCNHYQIPLRKIAINGPRVSDQYVPARNALLLTLALMHFSHEVGIISLGIHAGTPYADCSPQFVNDMERLFSLYEEGRVRIDAPFLTWKKQDIWLYATSNAVPLHLTHSSNSEDLRRINEAAVAHCA